MGSSRPSLPLELIEQVFALLTSTDRKTLKTCSLVSRTALHLTRKFLFRDVFITLEPNSSKGVTGALSSSAQFLSFIASDDYVASFIRKMHIDHPSAHVDESTMDWSMTWRTLAEIHPKLTQLRSLTLHSSFFSDWTMLNHNVREVLVRCYNIPTLHHLELHHVGMTGEELLSLSGIHKLALIGLFPKTNPATSLPQSDPSNPIMHAAPTRVPSLRDLSITLRNPETAEYMFSLARCASATLTSLKWMTSPYHESQDTCLDIIDLQALTSLSFLAVCLPLDKPSLAGLGELFRRAGDECKLEVVELICDYRNIPNEETVSSWSWKALDAALASSAYSTLRRVEVTVKEAISAKHRSLQARELRSHEALSLFRTRLPMLQARGFIFPSESGDLPLRVLA